MTGLLTFLKGSVRVELNCRYAERAINLCAKNHVDFTDLRRTPEGAVRMTVGIGGYAALRRISRETGAFTVKTVRREGAPFLLWRVRRRYALLAGLALCAAAIAASTLFVWQIDVAGNETVPSSRILAALREEGVDIGAGTLGIPRRQVENRMLLKIPELSFISLNTHGSRIEVLVREKIQKPELYDPDVPTSVFAEKAGIVADVLALQGVAKVKPGDAVTAGDELISAFVPLGKGRLTHAAGSVTARTWVELSASTPVNFRKKTATGEKKTRRAIILGGKRINFYFTGGNPYAECDKITVYKKLTLPGGAVLPVTFVRETWEEYESQEYAVTVQEAERILSSRLLWELEERIGSGSVVSTQFETAEESGVITVTLRAECLEEIGVERPLTGEETAALRPEGE